LFKLFDLVVSILQHLGCLLFKFSLEQFELVDALVLLLLVLLVLLLVLHLQQQQLRFQGCVLRLLLL
jgi:hypothetical protein